MNTTNKVQLMGNLGAAPEVKIFETGSKLARFSMATTEEVTKRNGEKITSTQWHNVSAWGKLAEKIEAEFKKGSFVSIEGKLVTDTYTDKTGQKKYYTQVVANEATINQKIA